MRKKMTRFKFSGKMAKLLGRESVSSDVAALFELIKNAYDADAEKVDVIFENFTSENEKNAKILIVDNGRGMNAEDIENKWMLIGTADKEKHPLTIHKKRVVIGNKGIGRFATEKLCRSVTIISKSIDTKEQIKLTINWDEYEEDDITFDDVINYLEIDKREDKNDIGTTLILNGIREPWSSQKINRLRLSIGSLMPPKELSILKNDKFEVNVRANEFGEQQSTKIQSLLLKYAPYKIISTIKKNNIQNVKIMRRGVEIVNEDEDLSIHDLDNGDNWKNFGSCKLIVYFFPGRSRYEDWNKYYKKVLNINNITNMLKDLNGIKIYRDGFWIRPYGELNDDWLSLEGERVQSNYKIGNSQIIGFVQISKEYNPMIIDTTTRERLVENIYFHSMRLFVKNAIEIINNHRKEHNKKLKEKQTKKIHQNLIESDIKRLKNLIDKSSLPSDEKQTIRSLTKDITDTFTDYEQTSEDEISTLESTQRSYMNLASLGISSVTTAHEIKPVISHLGEILQKVMNKLKNDAKIKQLVEKDLLLASDQINIIRYYMSFIIHFVESISSENEMKRKKEKIVIYDEMNKFLEYVDGIMKKSNTHISVSISPQNLMAYMHRADFSSVIINLCTNSLKALRKLPKGHKRKIKITIGNDTKGIKIKFSDNGLGIKPINRNKIFRVFYTTNQQGTGLGLSIIKELLDDYDGKIELSEHSELEHGATFKIYIPLRSVHNDS